MHILSFTPNPNTMSKKKSKSDSPPEELDFGVSDPDILVFILILGLALLYWLSGLSWATKKNHVQHEADPPRRFSPPYLFTHQPSGKLLSQYQVLRDVMQFSRKSIVVCVWKC